MADLAIDSDDNIYTCLHTGSAASNPGQTVIVLRSTDKGSTWTQVDKYLPSTNGHRRHATSIITSGNYVFYASNPQTDGSDTVGDFHFVIRSSSTGDVGSFGTVLSYTGSITSTSNTGKATNVPNKLFKDSSGILYCAGSEQVLNSFSVFCQAILFRSTNGGANWSIVDHFSSSVASGPFSGGADFGTPVSASGQFVTQGPDNSIYWGGFYSMSSSGQSTPTIVSSTFHQRWFVRKSETGASSSFSNFFEYVANSSSLTSSNNVLNSLVIFNKNLSVLSGNISSVQRYLFGGRLLETGSAGGFFNAVILKSGTEVASLPQDINVDSRSSYSPAAISSKGYGYNIPEIIVTTGSIVTIDCKVFGV